MAIEIITDGGVPQHLSICIYGPAGSGKTVGAATTSPGPVLVLNSEGESATAVAHGRAGDRLREARVERSSDLAEVLRSLHGDGADVQTVVVDSISALYELLTDEAAGSALPDTDHYAAAGARVRRLLRELRRRPVHVIVVAREWDLSERGHNRVRPKAGGEQTTTMIEGAFDAVGFTGSRKREDGSTEYLAQFGAGAGRFVKDRSGALGTHCPVDLSEWIQAMQEGFRAQGVDQGGTESEREAA